MSHIIQRLGFFPPEPLFDRSLRRGNDDPRRPRLSCSLTIPDRSTKHLFETDDGETTTPFAGTVNDIGIFRIFGILRNLREKDADEIEIKNEIKIEKGL